MHHMPTTTTPPPSTHVRLTIPVTHEVHQAFQRLAQASGMSTGRAMGEWLGDTLDAVLFMADSMEKARSAPRLVAQQLHSYALGLTDETGELLRKIRSGEVGATPGGMRQHPQAGATTAPPSCNTGGKVPRENPKTRGKKS